MTRPAILQLLTLMAALAPASLVPTAAASAQAADRPALDYGPHAVGFTVIEALDSTRAFRPLRDFRGRLAAQPARPIQVTLWYPADAPSGAQRMRAGDFRVLRETELTPGIVPDEAEVERLRSAFIEAAVRFGGERAGAERLWDEETPAVRDASRLPGPHPAVLYVGAVGVSDPLLPAYLASHGFVVAGLPNNGRMTAASLEFSPNALTIDTRIDDIGFVYGLLRRLPWVDTRRLAIASFSGSSLAALLWAMRDMQAAAVVTIEGWERFRRGADLIAESIHYEPHRLRVPFLMLERAADETSPSYHKVPDVVDALPYSDITRVAFRDASHADFLSHVTFGHTTHHAEIYAASGRTIRRFLEATIGGPDHAAGLAGSAAAPAYVPAECAICTVARRAAVGPVPTEEELFRLAETDPAAAAAAYRAATRIVPGHTLFRERVLNRAARFAGDPADSAVIMEIVRDAYPDAGTTQRSAAALLANAAPAFLAVSVSDLDAATAWYRDVLGLEPVRDAASSDATMRVRVLQSASVVAELIQHAASRAPSDMLEPGDHRFRLQGLVKAGLFVEDLDRVFQHLRDRGIETDDGIRTDGALGLRFFVFRDPDGNRIQTFQTRP